MKVFYNQELRKQNSAKQERHEAFEFLRSRQGDNSEAIKLRNRQIMMKLKRSQKQVEEFMRNQNHELTLKQELRKLRTEDIVKKKVREKRKELNTKEQIIKKEQDDERLLKIMRDREKILIETRHSNMMKSNFDKIAHIESLEKWVKRGFSTSRGTLKHLRLTDAPQLADLSKKMSSPIKIVRQDAPEI